MAIFYCPGVWLKGLVPDRCGLGVLPLGAGHCGCLARDDLFPNGGAGGQNVVDSMKSA